MFFKKSNRQYGSAGSIDNSELDILLDNARTAEKENIMLDMLREKIKEDNSITNTPVKLGKTLETIQTGSNSEVLIVAMELLKMCEEREKEWEKEGKQMENTDMSLEMEKIMMADTIQGILKEQKEKDNPQYSIVTKDEYILNFVKRFGGNKERATESFKNISQGYNFIFAIGDNQYYSVDYINKLLER